MCTPRGSKHDFRVGWYANSSVATVGNVTLVAMENQELTNIENQQQMCALAVISLPVKPKRNQARLPGWLVCGIKS